MTLAWPLFQDEVDRAVRQLVASALAQSDSDAPVDTVEIDLEVVTNQLPTNVRQLADSPTKLADDSMRVCRSHTCCGAFRVAAS